MGGGARSITKISLERFRKKFRRLTKKQKDVVDDIQHLEHQWRNDHANLRVFSTDCKRWIQKKPTEKNSRCDNCQSLLSNNQFRTTLRKPVPADENFRYVNYRFRNSVLGEQYARTKGLKHLVESAVCHIYFFRFVYSIFHYQDAEHSPFVRFAEGALAGKFVGHEVFTGLVSAMVTKIDKEERGVGMQGFSYAPAWDEFVHIVGIHSPRALKFLSEHFPARSMRSIRSVSFYCITHTLKANL